jgi:hypothetical protein
MKYWFDESDHITKVDENWLRFASENGADQLTPAAVKGQHLSSFIADEGTRDLWARLLERARAGTPVAITIRCDAPDVRRTLLLRLRTDRARVRVTTTLVASEERPRIDLLATPRPTKGSPLIACGWCRRFELAPGVWVEVEVLVENLRLLVESVLPPVRNTICPECRAKAEEQIHQSPAHG